MCEDAWYVHELERVVCGELPPFSYACVVFVRTEDLRTQFQDAEKSAARLTSGTDAVRTIVANTQSVVPPCELVCSSHSCVEFWREQTHHPAGRRRLWKGYRMSQQLLRVLPRTQITFFVVCPLHVSQHPG